MEDDCYDQSIIQVSVIICTYNRFETLKQTIISLEAQDLPKELFELVVVDNSSDINQREKFLSAFSTLCNCMYSIEERKGLSRARNRGVELASGPIVCFIDDDAIADPGWVRLVASHFREDISLGVIGGQVMPIWPHERPNWLHVWQEGFLTIVDRGIEARALQSNEWLAGTNIAFRKELIISSGGFDETLGRRGQLLLSNEEVRLCEKIASEGYGIWYFPDLLVLHRVHADRIDQSWLRRRVAFQVMSELLDDDDGSVFDPKKAVDAILDFADSMPARSRSISGLFQDVPNPEIFHKQTVAIAALMRFCLLGGADWRQFV